jgi:hypothetical protein
MRACIPKTQCNNGGTAQETWRGSRKLSRQACIGAALLGLLHAACAGFPAPARRRLVPGLGKGRLLQLAAPLASTQTGACSCGHRTHQEQKKQDY